MSRLAVVATLSRIYQTAVRSSRLGLFFENIDHKAVIVRAVACATERRGIVNKTETHNRGDRRSGIDSDRILRFLRTRIRSQFLFSAAAAGVCMVFINTIS